MLSKIAILNLITIFLFAGQTLAQNNLSSFKWTCTNSGKCVPIRNNTVTRPLFILQGIDFGAPTSSVEPQRNTNQYESQNVCRLVCGKYGSLFPFPTVSTIIGDTVIDFNVRNIAFNLNSNSEPVNQYLNKMIPIFLVNIRHECTNLTCSFDSDNQLKIKLSALTNNLKFNWDTEEGYSLNIAKDGKSIINVHISSNTVYGLRNGLETLSQLITSKSHQNNGVLDTLVIAQSVQISDNPVYSHRGLLVDTARNFIPIDTLKRIVDGMAASKLNVLHWHATDSQSFPLELKTVPQMARQVVKFLLGVYYFILN